MQAELTGYEYILERQLKPEARTDIRLLLQGLGVRPTSMIDISDGLASEILHICKQSNTGCKLFEEKIPIAEETRLVATECNIAPTVCALSGGEDYELLFTIPQGDYEKIKDVMGINIIGLISKESEGALLIARDGKVAELTAQGWNAF